MVTIRRIDRKPLKNCWCITKGKICRLEVQMYGIGQSVRVSNQQTCFSTKLHSSASLLHCCTDHQNHNQISIVKFWWQNTWSRNWLRNQRCTESIAKTQTSMQFYTTKLTYSQSTVGDISSFLKLDRKVTGTLRPSCCWVFGAHRLTGLMAW